MPKLLKFNEKALKSLLKGVKILGSAVGATLGPKGRHVMIKQLFGALLSTKDGQTVASEVILKDKFENMGGELIKEAALKTSKEAGDGTTTAIVLAEALVSEGIKKIFSGFSPSGLKRGMDLACQEILHTLLEMSKPVKAKAEIAQIASLSAGGDEA
ncbi:MAG: TCP-1/cpn60 chaperonin family protein, partial [Parachlamydiales bacterium]